MKVGERKGNTVYHGDGKYTGVATLKGRNGQPDKHFDFEFIWYDEDELGKSWKGDKKVFAELFKGALEQRVIKEARTVRPVVRTKPKSAIGLLNEFARQHGFKSINDLALDSPELVTKAVEYAKAAQKATPQDPL